MREVKVSLRGQGAKYLIKIASGSLTQLGAELRACLGDKVRRVLLVSNPTVFALYGKQAERSLRTAEFAVTTHLIGDGERHKNWRTLDGTLKVLTAQHFERSDAVVALGGGVVGDLAGLAAALYLRGLAFAQVPTTLLAQIDSSVGGKVAVNTATGKNILGTFHQPRLVIIDPQTLTTLPRRELTAGWCEAIKQGAIGSRTLFERTVSQLNKFSLSDNLKTVSSELFAAPEFAALLAAQVKFKAKIVRADEREDLNRTDAQHSRRILNFGHTVGHALEAVTQYRYFRHGEAVGYGMLAAGEIAKRLAMFPPTELECLRAVVQLCGALPRADQLSLESILAALSHDKKSVGGQIKWVLLERIGKPVIVDGSEVSADLVRSSLQAALVRP